MPFHYYDDDDEEEYEYEDPAPVEEERVSISPKQNTVTVFDVGEEKFRSILFHPEVAT